MKYIKWFILVCFIMLTFVACAQEENVLEDGNSEENSEIIIENDLTNQKENEILIKFYNDRVLAFNNAVYVFLGKNLWKIDSSQQITPIIECKEAVGYLSGEYLYWAVWKEEGTLSIIRIDRENQIFEVGILEKDMPPDMLDFYGDVLYIQYEIGKVEGYHLNQYGKIEEEASVEEMQLYAEENQAAEQRMKNLQEPYSAQSFLKHIVPAGYSREICGKEFLSKYMRQGENGFWQMIERSNKQDRILFTFYDEVIMDMGKVIYFDSIDKNKLVAYDLLKEENSVIYEFKDGTFDFFAVEENVIYGVWNSVKQLKSYFVAIDIKDSKMIPYFETKAGQEYLMINKIVYYMDDRGIVICPIEESLKESIPQMDVVLAWSYLKNEYFSYCDTEKISYDADGRLLIVLGEQRMPFSSDGEYYRCESVVRLDEVNSDNYIFEHHYVYYEDNGEVYAIKLGGRYYVNCYTGEIINH